MHLLRSQRSRVLLGVLLTLTAIHFIPNRLLVVAVLLLLWAALFHPISTSEAALFVLAALFFTSQNYVTLRAGLFEFTFKDVLLMPYYEPLLWGFYFLSMKRFIAEDTRERAVIDKKSVAGVIVTCLLFSVFSFDSRLLFIATACSTTILLVLFHTRGDVGYALFALALGLVIELFGVSTGLWSYPAPDFLGIPYWFATMWISVGLLGRRFLIPASEWLAGRLRAQLA